MAIGLFMGSLYSHKLIPFLIDAAREIRLMMPGFHLIVAGAGPQQTLVEQVSATGDGGIHYVGPIFGKKRATYLGMASVFLNPGLVGLAILDAFAAGLPVGTTDFEYHSPEIEYLRADQNGLMTQRDPLEYAQAVVALLQDELRLARFRHGALETARSHSIDAMVERFHRGILAWLHSRGKEGHG